MTRTEVIKEIGKTLAYLNELHGMLSVLEKRS
jgi:hypothetical protein